MDEQRKIDLIIGRLVGLSLQELYSKYMYCSVPEIREAENRKRGTITRY